MHCFCTPVCIVFRCNCRFNRCNCRFRRFRRFAPALVTFPSGFGSLLGNFGRLRDHAIGLVIPETFRALLEKRPEDIDDGALLLLRKRLANSLEPLFVEGERLACRIVIIEQAPITKILEVREVSGIPSIIPREKWIPLISHDRPLFFPEVGIFGEFLASEKDVFFDCVTGEL